MNDRILELLRDVVRLSDDHVADQCPRHDSEPFISIWEKAARLARERASPYLFDQVSGDHRQAVHASPAGMMERLEDLKVRLSAKCPSERGLYAEFAAIEQELRASLTFV